MSNPYTRFKRVLFGHPLASDRLSLRLVGFTTKDAGFIDNVLSDSQGGTFDNSNVADKDVNETETDGARAAGC